MSHIISVRGKTPTVGDDCFLAPTATLIGDVAVSRNCSLWFNTVIRGDVASISIGHNSNIQDGVIIHGTYQKADTIIGNYVSVGHRALVHGCTLEDYVLIGMGAIVMDHAVVEQGALIAAGAVVLENTVVEAGCLYAGVPARKVKKLDVSHRERMQTIANNYSMYASWYNSE
ncbi:gamma carbonic anhydrase family protein [Tunicatimonas pelagia]|uniref:gamma carbonic anhydrase family protein n=1 Tax=Tunicatimonas pelagia TaxID=931531 RepID=UPI002665170A|nr:gamma carbonic anhydrase family protein [Tunicatimonas pelagia]WKN42508.1 gamma carbonic anhydrase family protein [Tunicatimonas pelagia]